MRALAVLGVLLFHIDPRLLPGGFSGVDVFSGFLITSIVLCGGGTCSPYLDRRPVYFDPSHMSMDGSWLLGRKLLAAGQPLPGPLLAKGPGP